MSLWLLVLAIGVIVVFAFVLHRRMSRALVKPLRDDTTARTIHELHAHRDTLQAVEVRSRARDMTWAPITDDERVERLRLEAEVRARRHG